MGKFRVGGVVVAAGLSRRMGDFKPLLPLGNKTIIEATVDNLKSAGVNDIVVVVGYRGDEVAIVIYDRGVNIVWNYDYEKSDMFHTVKLGIKNLRQCDCFFVVPGDMPLISGNTFKLIKKAMQMTQAKIVIPTLDNRPKHPPLIHINCIEGILKYEGNNGLRGALTQFRENTHYVPVWDIGCGIDVDTQKDYVEIIKIINEKEVSNASYK